VHPVRISRHLVSIHAPLARSDRYEARRVSGSNCFNPRSPREERREAAQTYDALEAVSIHAPLARSDPIPRRYVNYPLRFNPRSPREERRLFVDSAADGSGFNPRSPREERLTGSFQIVTSEWFQSTLPSRGATCS